MSATRPRIVQVITRLIVGGAQLSVVALCEELSDEFDLRIVCGPQTGAEGSLRNRAAASAPLTVVESLRRELSPRWDPVAVPALRRTLRGLDGEIVHTHSSKAGIVGRFAAAPLPARVVHTVHGWGHTPSDSFRRRSMFIALERSAARRCDALVAVSADNRDEGLELGIGRPGIYRIIPELVRLDPIDPDFNRARARARLELGIAEGVELIGWVGRFVEQKDPRTLAGVLAALLQKRAAAQAVLIGDGPSRAEVQARLDEAGVGHRAKLMGVVHEARRLMPAFDVVIHPSRWEGQPRVVQEALAERIPVVAARASGVGELIAEGATGFVVAPRAVEEMIAATSRILDTPTLRAPLSEQALADLKASHGSAVAVARHRELYRELSGGSPVNGQALVGVDVRRATLWPQTGIARYSRNLMRAMTALAVSDLRIAAIDVDGPGEWPQAITVGRGTPAARRAIQEQVRMAALSRRLDLLHLPWSEGPVRPLCPLVLTLFDLATLDGASSYELGFRAYYNTLLRAHVRSASAVIVASRATLDAARERWPKQRYHLIPLAVDPRFRLLEGEARTPEPTILYTGGFDPRKRVADLVEAVARVRTSIPSARLVLSGAAPAALIELARRRLGPGALFCGYLAEEELAAWYRRAWVVAYPTDMEGFGFPLVEAFASGTPVVATRVGSVEEVAGGAALLVGVGDVEGLGSALVRLLEDDALRDSLRAAGVRRASGFSWDVVARRTVDVYREVLAGL